MRHEDSRLDSLISPIFSSSKFLFVQYFGLCLQALKTKDIPISLSFTFLPIHTTECQHPSINLMLCCVSKLSLVEKYLPHVALLSCIYTCTAWPVQEVGDRFTGSRHNLVDRCSFVQLFIDAYVCLSQNFYRCL